MRVRLMKSLFFSLALLYAACPAEGLMTADFLSLTVAAHALADLNLPQIPRGNGFGLLPFYLRVNLLAGGKTMNWGMELYSDNQPGLNAAGYMPTNGLYRGLHGNSVTAHCIPLYWQAYGYDQNSAITWGTAVSVTTTAGKLQFSQDSLPYWGMVYDRNDADKVNVWTATRAERMVASTDWLGAFPSASRKNESPSIFIYCGADMRGVLINQSYSGTLVLELLRYPFDYNTGCYATPNPVKPILGQSVCFNFFTNDPNSQTKISIYDPTGFPVMTLHNTRFWNCRNNSGHLVEGGLYIYQIEAEGHLISGTVVVIK